MDEVTSTVPMGDLEWVCCLARGTRGRPSPRAKWGQVPPEERQQNAEEAHRARSAPRGALPEKTGTCRRLAIRK